MAAFLFTIYLIAGCFFIPRIKFIREAGLGTKVIILLFLVKIAAGCALGLVNHFMMHNTTDYDVYNSLGLVEYHNLFSNPRLFFTDIFKSNYADYGEYFGSAGSYWNDLRTGILLKVLGVMDIFSRGNYYINSLFFNMIAFFGHIALFRVFIHIYPGKKLQVIVGCFLLPSMLYFSSGIHKDLIVFTALAVFCYSLYVSLDCGFTRKRFIFLLLAFLIMLLIRNFVAVIALPFAVAWFISSRYKLKPAIVFPVMILVVGAALCMMHFGPEKYDPLRVVVEKQQSFFALGTASTQYHNDTLAPTIKSFAFSAPKALAHAYLSPYPGEFDRLYINLFSVEITTYLLVFFLWVLFPVRTGAGSNSFIFFCVLFSFAVFLFTGYITPSAGALIRYRSIYWPFIFTPLLAGVNWKRVFPYKISTNRR